MYSRIARRRCASGTLKRTSILSLRFLNIKSELPIKHFTVFSVMEVVDSGVLKETTHYGNHGYVVAYALVFPVLGSISL